MAEHKKEPTDAEVAAKTGFETTAEEEAQKESAGSEEETETEEEAEEAAEADESESEEEAEEEKPAARSKRDISETEEEEESDEAAKESEEDDIEAEDESDKPEVENSKKRTVPYSKLKSARTKIKDLEAELAVARKGKEEAEDSGDDDAAEEADKEVETVAKKLGEELGLDEAGVAKILKAAVTLSSKKSVIPKDIKAKLEALEKESLATKEAAHFGKEWVTLDVKKQYPNASKAALKEAQDLMDKLAHTKEHHQHDLDYILFKNKAKFETILKAAAKKKSGEAGKRVGRDDSEIEAGEDEENLTDITELTPEIMRKREANERNMRRAHRNDKDYTVHSPQRDE